MSFSKEINPDDFVFFAIRKEYANRASNGFTLAYYDKASGEDVVYKDVNGYPKKYKFTKSRRMIRVPAKRETELEFIRNHPECEGSPNGTYREVNGKLIHVNSVFLEINEEKDAEIVIDAALLRSKALSAAVALLDDTSRAEQVALILGFKSIGKNSGAKILTFAEADPKKFLEVVNSPEIEYRGLVMKALSTGVLQRNGISYFINDVEYGFEPDDILKEIIRDEDKYRLLYKKVNGVDPVFDQVDDDESDEGDELVKKKAGRPKKS